MVADSSQRAGCEVSRLAFGLIKQGFTLMRAKLKEHFLNPSGFFVFGIKPTDWHLENLSHLTHQLEVGRVFATLVLVHPGTGRHRIDAGEFAKLFLG